jgi:hypothetical protein
MMLMAPEPSPESYRGRAARSTFGGLAIDLYRLGAGYVDRIRKGEKPADLPVQLHTSW